MKPRALASAPKPKMLPRAAAISPPIRIPRRPPKRDAPVAGAAVEPALGCVMDRSIGAARGAVLVAGGLEKVRDPRLPKLLPPPTRASAVVANELNAPSIAKLRAQGAIRSLPVDIATSDRRVSYK